MVIVSFRDEIGGSTERVETSRDAIEFDDNLGAWRVLAERRELVIPPDHVDEIVSESGEPLFGY